MRRIFVNTLLTAILLSFYIRWSLEQAESQIDKMQDAAFNTLGTEAPLPPHVLLVGFSILCGHFLLARRLTQLTFVATTGSFFAASLTGAIIYIFGFQKQS